jgi:PAS domain S-box-containing protein
VAAPERAGVARLLRLLPEAAALTRAPDGLLLDANEAFEELTAYHRGELLGHTMAQLGLWHDPAESERLLREAAATGQARSLETQLRPRDGRLISVLVSVSCLMLDGESCCLAAVRDLTEYKQAEELLRLERQRLQFVLAGGQHGFWDWNIQTGEVRRNERWAEMLGYTLEEIEFTVAQWMDLIHPDDRDRAWQSIQDHLEGRSSAHRCEYRMRTKQGDYRWILDQAVIVQRDPEGRPFRMSGTHTDITERRQVEEEVTRLNRELERLVAERTAQLEATVRQLKKTLAERERIEEQFRTIADFTSDWEYWVGPDRELRYVSPSCEPITGYQPSEFLEDTSLIDRVVYPEDWPAYRAEHSPSRLSEDGLRAEASEVEFRIVRKDGGVRWIRHLCRPVFGRDGQFLGRRVSNGDITARKAAEQALRASEAAYRELVENINEVIYATDATGVLTYISPAIERVLGYAPSEAVGRPVESFVHPDDVPAVRRRFAGPGAGRFVATEYRVVAKSGEPRWTRISSRPTVEGGVFVGVRGTLADITDWKQAQEEARRLQAQLLRSQKLAALGEIISGIAHELNNPLAAVVAYAQLMQERELPREAADDASAVAESALRASRVVQNLLAFARHQEPRRTPLAINEVVEGVLRLRAAHLSAGGIDVVTQLAPDLPPVLADHHQLEQVLLNLVNNAERALLDTPGPRLLTLSTRAAGDWLQLRVADTGVGIPEDLLARIFAPFLTTREAGQGTGLGLSICQAIISDHDGRISVSSRLGEGTEFLVELPTTTEPLVAEEPRVLPAVSFAGRRALVVEDELLVRLPLARMLEEMGLEVASAADAEAALQILTGGECEVIVCDMKMPGMDGRAFHDEVRRRWPSLARRFVVCTGDVPNPDTVAFAEAIGAPLLAKPFLAADVRAAIAEVLAEDGPERPHSDAARS